MKARFIAKGGIRVSLSVRQNSRGASGVPSVLVVGDDLLSELLKNVLEAHGVVTLRVVPRDPELEEAISRHPSVALFDVEPFSAVAGEALIARLRAADMAVGVISNGPAHQGLETWLNAGASAVIDSGTQIVELFGLVNRLLNTSEQPAMTITPNLRAEIRNLRSEMHRVPFAILTEREQEVLAELMEGHCAEEIANSACVSISTVRSQIKSVLQKLGVNSQLAAVALARRAGWSLDRTHERLGRRAQAS